MKKAVALIPFLLLTQCATTPEEEKDPGLDRSPYHLAEKTSPTLAGVNLPILKSPALEKRWGSPRITILPTGGYHLRYTKPGNEFESLSIYAAPGTLDSDAPTPPGYFDMGYDEKKGEPISIPVKQSWRTVDIAGRSTHVYTDSPGSGADPLQLSTVTFPASRPGKHAASFRVTATSNLEDGESIILSYMRTVAWAGN
ncbi:hypothetical protein OVA24_08390 [Luteolibacter sp. SL250]|uniref:hypothetical protein n=1 Tax=Luteolibacter sp. SL250 TaxID=2995170 RepID=UPI00226E92A7|nr:hypothetical protein [Luteolibacter sp. SL250]WAC21404.1 hypothetical protein OVA24_08390 [Luteolibacter sp. SL250]